MTELNPNITVKGTAQQVIKNVTADFLIDGEVRQVVVSFFNPQSEEEITIGLNNRYITESTAPDEEII